MLMFVALSLGILAALTGTGISQIAPAFADKEDCEDNDDNNCNERNKKNQQTNDCPIIAADTSGVGNSSVHNLFGLRCKSG